MKNLEKMGFEPMASYMRSKRSTTELHPRDASDCQIDLVIQKMPTQLCLTLFNRCRNSNSVEPLNLIMPLFYWYYKGME